MKKKRWAILTLTVLIIISSAGILTWDFFRTSTVTMEFEESDADISNPFRGFYYQTDTSDGRLPEQIAEDDLRLLLLTFDLKEEKEGAISSAKLAELEYMLKLAKEAGIQVIFRAAYGFGSEYKYKDPENPDIILAHIGQIAPLLNEYGENMLCVQAGFLGPWGEWHHSNLLGEDEEENREIRNLIIGEWVELLEAPVTVNVRRPRFVRDAIEAGIPADRLGVHNDALLSGADDMATYDDEAYSREEELLWIDEHLNRGRNGGEMPALSEYTRPEHAAGEFERLHLTYLNSSYNKEVLDDWKTQKLNGGNAYDVIAGRLGYRLGIENISVTDELRGLHSIELTVRLSNSGFAAAPEGYGLYAVVDRGTDISFYPAELIGEETASKGGASARKERALSGGAALLADIPPEESMGLRVKIPVSELKNSDYVRLGLLLSREAVSGDEAAIRLANDELLWENGINYIGSYRLEGRVYRFDRGTSAIAVSEGKPAEEKSRMEMVIFKIGKADAILLISEDRTLLIDTGEDEDGEEVLEYLRANDINKLDVMILSHFDKDHVGGADKIIEGVEVGTIYQPDYAKDSGQYKEYMESAEAVGVDVVTLKEPANIRCGGMEVFIYPPERDDYKEENDYSLAATVVHGKNRFFFTGDAESERMKELIGSREKIEGGLAHDFLKVPHHGREDEMFESFLNEVSPDVAVITCSAKNPPDDEVATLLEENGISVYLTMEGNIYVESNGEEITVRQ